MNDLFTLAGTANPADLVAARTHMALPLDWHIVIASFGMGMPAVTVFAEWRGIRRADTDCDRSAHR